jgi:diguanylate cyclase (GGDEF)-like protein
MAHTNERRAPVGVDPEWLNPAESLAEARAELRLEQAREQRRQGIVLRSYLAASVALSVAFAFYFQRLPETPQQLAAFVSLAAAASMVGAFIGDVYGHRTAAGVVSQLAPVVPVLIYAWIFSVEAGFGSYLFIGALGLVVLVPDHRQRTRLMSVAVLVLAVVVVQVVFTRERALAPLPIDQTTALATFNRTIMSLSLFTLALLLNRSVRVARMLVRSSLALSKTEANTDVLTGLPHRRPVWERVSDLVDAETPFTLALADVDHFKRLNDHYGHDCGDQTLVRISRELAAAVREQDIVGRWGGEEFIVVLAGDHEGAARAIERVHASVTGTAPECDDDAPPVTVSIGYAPWFPGDDPWKTLRRADHALYAAKRAGRNRVLAADTEVDGA